MPAIHGSSSRRAGIFFQENCIPNNPFESPNDQVRNIGLPEENTRGVNFPFFYGENGEFLPGIPNHFFLVIVRLFLRYFLHFLLATV